MEKHKLLSLVNKTSTPTSVYSSLWDDIHFKPLLDKMSSEDIIFYSFLIPTKSKGQDIDETYDRIEHNMYSVELIEIYNTEPEVDCPECRNGREKCDNCDGEGEILCTNCDGSGEEDCRYCDGSGMDEDSGEECDMCEGDGKQTCEVCNSTNYESCNYCGGEGEYTCGYCEGSGQVVSKDKVEVQYLNYISWSNRWKEYFFDKKPDQQLDSEDTRNFHNNSQTLFLGMHEEITDEYQGYENGEVLLWVAKDTKDLNLRKHSDRIYP
jgi:hypothetical protein